MKQPTLVCHTLIPFVVSQSATLGSDLRHEFDKDAILALDRFLQKLRRDSPGATVLSLIHHPSSIVSVLARQISLYSQYSLSNLLIQEAFEEARTVQEIKLCSSGGRLDAYKFSDSGNLGQSVSVMLRCGAWHDSKRYLNKNGRYFKLGTKDEACTYWKITVVDEHKVAICCENRLIDHCNNEYLYLQEQRGGIRSSQIWRVTKEGRDVEGNWRICFENEKSGGSLAAAYTLDAKLNIFHKEVECIDREDRRKRYNWYWVCVRDMESKPVWDTFAFASRENIGRTIHVALRCCALQIKDADYYLDRKGDYFSLGANSAKHSSWKMVVTGNHEVAFFNGDRLIDHYCKRYLYMQKPVKPMNPYHIWKVIEGKKELGGCRTYQFVNSGTGHLLAARFLNDRRLPDKRERHAECVDNEREGYCYSRSWECFIQVPSNHNA